MNSCIDASDQRPRDFYPNFVPQNGTPPIQVLPTPTISALPASVSPETPLPTWFWSVSVGLSRGAEGAEGAEGVTEVMSLLLTLSPLSL